MLPARLANSNSQRVEATLEQQNKDTLSRDLRVPTSPRLSRCLSPISLFSFPEPFSDSSDSTSADTSPARQVRSVGNIIRRNHQDTESEYPNHLTFVSALSLNLSFLSHF